MPLDPQAQQLLETLATLGMPDFSSMSPEQARTMIAATPRPAGEDVASATDRAIPGPAGDIPVRVYVPAAGPNGGGIVYYHGGGWVFGTLDSIDYTCRMLANASGATVVSVDYRLAPEHPFPAAVDDAYAALAWASANAAELAIDPAQIAVAGDSAGGNLAAVVSIMARGQLEPPIAFQGLIYPVTHCAFETESYSTNAEGYLLSRKAMEWFWGHYAQTPEHRLSELASPLLAENLGGLPPALVITAEYDPLRDEGDAYATRLKEAGNSVEYQCYDGMIHGFFGNPAMDRGRTAVEHVARAFKQTAALG